MLRYQIVTKDGRYNEIYAIDFMNVLAIISVSHVRLDKVLSVNLLPELNKDKVSFIAYSVDDVRKAIAGTGNDYPCIQQSTDKQLYNVLTYLSDVKYNFWNADCTIDLDILETLMCQYYENEV